MKKILTIFAAVMIIPAVAFAQYGGPGSLDINAGIGLGSNLTGTGLPVGLSVEYGLNEEISIGGYAGYASTKENFGSGEWKYTNFIIGARGSYHKELVDNINTYGGIMLGYNMADAEWSGPGNAQASVGGFTYAGFVGARYHFSEKLGLFGEVGYGIAFLQTGLTIRM
jgi:hypothetical protein